MSDFEVPAELGYTAEHEWVAVADGVARVGITAFAQDALGDIVFVTLPSPGTEVIAGAAIGEVESTKSVSDVYSPVSGTLLERNEALDASPELVNADPYGEGWMFTVRLVADEEPQLLSAEDYRATLG
jgi:glycine cleavage system H protein